MSNKKTPKELLELRKKVSQLDHKVLELVSERLALSQKIAWIKKEHEIFIEDEKREEEVLIKNLVCGLRLGLSKEFVLTYTTEVIKASKERQNKFYGTLNKTLP